MRLHEERPTTTRNGSVTKSRSATDHASSTNTKNGNTATHGFHGSMSKLPPSPRMRIEERDTDERSEREPPTPPGEEHGRDQRRRVDARHTDEHAVVARDPTRRRKEPEEHRPGMVPAEPRLRAVSGVCRPPTSRMRRTSSASSDDGCQCVPMVANDRDDNRHEDERHHGRRRGPAGKHAADRRTVAMIEAGNLSAAYSRR